MGLLYNAVKARQAENVAAELKQRGIHSTKDGTPIDQLSYKEQVVQLALAKVREVDVENSNNKWF